MITAKILFSIASVFIALVLACAVWLGRRRDTPAKPFHDKPSFGYTRAELEALTARSRARAAADPSGLRRPLFFKSVRSPSVRCEADGGDQVHPGFPAVRYFRAMRSIVPIRFARCAASSRAVRTAPLTCPQCFNHDDCANVEICRAIEADYTKPALPRASFFGITREAGNV